MSLVLSDELIRQTQSTEEELKIEIAVMLYQRKKLSIGQGCEFTGLDRLEFQRQLALRDVPLHYSVEDLHQDIETLKRLKSEKIA